MSDDYNRTDAERDDAREAMTYDHAETLEYCFVCSELACLYVNCPVGCDYKHGDRVGVAAIHEGACLAMYGEGELEIAALDGAVGR